MFLHIHDMLSSLFLNSFSFSPIRIPFTTPSSPGDEADFALSYIRGIIDDNANQIEIKLKSLNWGKYKNVEFSTSTFEFGEVSDETFRPTRNPTPQPTRRTPKPTRKPATPRPTFKPTVEDVETTYPVGLSYQNVASDYAFTSEDQAKITEIVKELLEQSLIDGNTDFELTEITYDGDGSSLDSFPISVSVKGPKDQSDYAYGIIMEAIEMSMEEMLKE